MTYVQNGDGKKTSKNLWIPIPLANAFDDIAAEMDRLIADKVEVGHVGAAAIAMFLKSPRATQLRAVSKAMGAAAEQAAQDIEREQAAILETEKTAAHERNHGQQKEA